MENGFFLITGTSKGIGEALAQKVLEKGHTVLGVSRNQSGTLNSTNYYHLSFDLANTSQLAAIIEKANEIVDNQSFDFIGLVNNASPIEPLKSIERCLETEIESHLKIGLIAPMILTSMFIRQFADSTIRKKVALISSAASFTALPGASMYCSSKAAINMFAQCVGLEQKNREYGFEVIAIGPGMVNTSMQRTSRSKTSDEFAMAGFFQKLFEDGKLQEPGTIAEKIYTILEDKYEQGKYVNVSEV